jgi:hypothetical protein
MVSTFRLSIKACVLATIFLVGCGGGPSGEFGTKEWCESIKKMPQKDLDKYYEELTAEQFPKVAMCLGDMGGFN